MNISNTILEQIGGTPLVRINKTNPGKAEIVAEVEFFNP
jgi:cysteine synthase